MLTARSLSSVTALGLLSLVATSGCKMNPHKSQWRTSTEAPLNARLALAGDALIITNYGPARADHLSSFALADGAERWQVPLDDSLLGSATGGVHVTADPDGAAVYL
ncbi:MAG: hypothetical protein M3N56_12810, partial [Actinomycetota bacterium]|nr:hypothetical protein [Actinomycetota bacterium]